MTFDDIQQEIHRKTIIFTVNILTPCVARVKMLVFHRILRIVQDDNWVHTLRRAMFQQILVSFSRFTAWNCLYISGNKIF